jgi:hypothetical protein
MLTGRWTAILIDPPVGAALLAAALALASPPPALALGALLAGAGVEQAAMTALTAGNDKPMTIAR